MKELFDIPEPGATLCNGDMEEALHLYLDGELPFEEQPLLFAHLAECDQCRHLMGSMMTFRRMSRQEAFPVPPAVDEAFFQRLNLVKSRSKRVDRYMDRRPLWQVRAPISLRAAAMAAVVVFVAGLMFPHDIGDRIVSTTVQGEEEQVEYINVIRIPPEAVYVFYPGLTVEAPKIVETTVTDPL